MSPPIWKALCLFTLAMNWKPRLRKRKGQWKYLFHVKDVLMSVTHLISFILNKWDQCLISKIGIQRGCSWIFLEPLEWLQCILHLTDEQQTETHSRNRIPNYTVEFSVSFLPHTLLNIFTLSDQQKRKCLDRVWQYLAAFAVAVSICQVF